MADKFRTKSGLLTRYALACGYVERFVIGETVLELWHEGGPCYHVRAHDHKNHMRVFWDSFTTLTQARKRFSAAKKELRPKKENPKKVVDN